MVLYSGVLRAASSFRTRFKLPDKNLLHWFPGHMHKGMKVMQQKLREVDCVIEVHDARIPLSGRNPHFKDTISSLRPHILVLNKVDLTDDCLLDRTVQTLKRDSNLQVVFTNCKSVHCKGIKQLLNDIKHIVSSSNRYNRNEEEDLSAMIIGVPNVGKSSLINVLRNKFCKKSNAVRVGAQAGITRNVGTKIKVSENPLIYIYDSPGILTPSVGNIEEGMKLALCSLSKDTDVGYINIADYLLYWMNKHKFYSYTSFLNLRNPTDDIYEALTVSAITYNYYITRKEFSGSGGYVQKPNLETAAHRFVAAFRKGTLGLYNLDCDYL